MTYTAFTYAVRRVGADVLNRLRLAIALGLLMILHTALYGFPIPTAVEGVRWLWLGLSGIVGFALSDALLYRALYHLGAHRTSLLTSSVPVASALLAWLAFGEALGWGQIVGIFTVMAGILLVVASRQTEKGLPSGGSVKIGILCALGAALAQASRYMLSVQGMRGGFPVVSTNVIQILAATLTVWLIALPRAGEWRKTLGALGIRGAALPVTVGAATGPFLGVTLSLVALSRTDIGVASTLMALVPIFLLPASSLLFHAKITGRTVAGTVLAVGGVALLFLA
jgi:drug/metabolite transporter (DMT)-like permease